MHAFLASGIAWEEDSNVFQLYTPYLLVSIFRSVWTCRALNMLEKSLEVAAVAGLVGLFETFYPSSPYQHLSCTMLWLSPR